MILTLPKTAALSHEDLLLIAAEHAQLLAAARASVASADLGESDPLIHVRHALAACGQMPPTGARPVVLLAQSAAALLPRRATP
ncbi:hypothetical protein ACIBCT_39095 [Streptosporangium sp. NPDC050855]|uniref:hypothetical protein n=1 Tax=Streptosporangium sp. NPDC050855 TaxID=3366194 RepID=UPI0037B9B9E9